MKLEEEKDRFERMIFSLKQNYSQKIEATEFSIKIKEQNLNEQFN